MSLRRGDMKGASEHLHPRVNDLISDLGWDLTPIQKASIPDLSSGKDRLMVAPTGSGKTTTVDIILGLIEAQKGTLEVDGKVITNQNSRS